MTEQVPSAVPDPEKIPATAERIALLEKRVKELTQSVSDLANIAGTNLQQAFAKIGDIAFKDQASKFLTDFKYRNFKK